MSSPNIPIDLLANLKKKEDTEVSGYFYGALAISFLLFAGMAIVVGLVLIDLDKCEKKPSPSCPFFTSPSADPGSPDSDYFTKIMPSKSNLLPNPYE